MAASTQVDTQSRPRFRCPGGRCRLKRWIGEGKRKRAHWPPGRLRWYYPPKVVASM